MMKLCQCTEYHSNALNKAVCIELQSTIMLLQICMKLMLDSPKEDNLVPFLVSLTKLASRSTHLASELVCSFSPYTFFLIAGLHRLNVLKSIYWPL